MPRVTTLALAALLLVPGLARADSLPDFDKYMACDGKAVDAACYVVIPESYEGTCQNIPCESAPQMTCLTCVPPEPETGTAGGTAGEGTAGPPTTGGSSGSGGGSGSTAGGSTGDGPSDSKGGCSCRSDSAPASGLLMALGAVLLRRRRR